MASSKEKAVGLKDAYVSGLLGSVGEEAAAEAGAVAMQELSGKLGMEQGQQASHHFDLDNGIQNSINDGSPSAIYEKGGVKLYERARGQAGQAYANPVKNFFGGATLGAEKTTHMSDVQLRTLDKRFNSRYSSNGGGTRLTPYVN